MILPLLLSLFATALGAPQQPLESIARKIFTNFTAGRFEAATKDFNDEMRATATPAKLAAMKESVGAQLGAFRYVMTVKRRTDNGWPVVDITAKYEKSDAIMTVFFDEDFRVSSVVWNPVTSPPPDPLEREAREFLTDFNAGRFEAVANRFDATLRQTLPPDRLETLSHSIAETYGTFTSVTETHSYKSRDLITVEMTADYQGKPVEVQVVFNRAHRIAGIRFAPWKKRS